MHCYFLVQQPVQERLLLPDHLRGGVSVRVLTAADTEIASALSRAEELGARLRRGDTCLAAFRDGRLVGYLWLCFCPFEDDETHCRFAPLQGAGGAWDYDLSVAPESRGGGAFAALWDAAWEVLRREGYSWTASRVSAFNDRSLRAHRRIGAVATGTLLVLRAGHAAAILSSLRPVLRLAGGRAAPATIVVHPRAGPPKR
jgi:GNAT superfamily N-acetyltransferase